MPTVSCAPRRPGCAGGAATVTARAHTWATIACQTRNALLCLPAEQAPAPSARHAPAGSGGEQGPVMRPAHPDLGAPGARQQTHRGADRGGAARRHPTVTAGPRTLPTPQAGALCGRARRPNAALSAAALPNIISTAVTVDPSTQPLYPTKLPGGGARGRARSPNAALSAAALPNTISTAVTTGFRCRAVACSAKPTRAPAARRGDGAGAPSASAAEMAASSLRGSMCTRGRAACQGAQVCTDSAWPL